VAVFDEFRGITIRDTDIASWESEQALATDNLQSTLDHALKVCLGFFIMFVFPAILSHIACFQPRLFSCHAITTSGLLHLQLSCFAGARAYFNRCPPVKNHSRP
jgi:hypothetical protein